MSHIQSWLNSTLWKEKWVHKSYPAINSEFEVLPGVGTHKEPGSSLWLSALCEGLKGCFREGMIVLDYGCGCGRLANFLSERVEHFNYYGLEPRTKFGERQLNYGKRFLKDDRVVFDFIGSDIEKEAIAQSNCAVLGSVFTHLDIHQSENILRKLMPICENGSVVFSIFLVPNRVKLNTYSGGRQVYDLKGTYDEVHHSKDSFQKMIDSLGIQLEESRAFDIHRIFNARVS